MAEVELNQKYTRVLPVDLPPKVQAQKGLELAMQLAEIEQLEAEMKSKNDDFKGLIGQRKKAVLSIRRSIDTGTENREVECMDIANPELQVIETHRLDVGRKHPKRIVSTRPMDLFEAAKATEETQADGEALAHAEAAEKKAKRSRKPKEAKAKAEAEAKPRANGTAHKSGNGHAKGVTSEDWDSVGDEPLIITPDASSGLALVE